MMLYSRDHSEQIGKSMGIVGKEEWKAHANLAALLFS